MLSLDNTYNEDDLRNWERRVHELSGRDDIDYVCELKLDGMSLLKAAGDPKGVLADRGVFLETAPNPRGVPTYIAVRTKRYRYDLQEDGQEGLYDLKEDPWELESVHDDPRYARIKTILRAAAEDLADCAGASCRKPVPPLPQPGR